MDTGSCQDGYHKRWYFDNARGECIAFIFSGCGGNLNNFKTFQSCVDFCKDYLTVTQPRKFAVLVALSTQCTRYHPPRKAFSFTHNEVYGSTSLDSAHDFHCEVTKW